MLLMGSVSEPAGSSKCTNTSNNTNSGVRPSPEANNLHLPCLLNNKGELLLQPTKLHVTETKSADNAKNNTAARQLAGQTNSACNSVFSHGHATTHPVIVASAWTINAASVPVPGTEN